MHDRTNVGKVEVDEARHDHEISDATNTLLQNLVCKLEGFFERRVGISDQEQILVWNDNQCVNMLLQLGNAGFCRAHPARSFKKEWLCNNTNCQNIHFTRNLGNNGSSTGSGSAPHTRSDEAHVATGQCGLHLLDGFFRGRTANFRT